MGFFLKIDKGQNRPKSCQYLGYFYKKICCGELSLNAQSGHSARYYHMKLFPCWLINLLRNNASRLVNNYLLRDVQWPYRLTCLSVDYVSYYEILFMTLSRDVPKVSSRRIIINGSIFDECYKDKTFSTIFSWHFLNSSFMLLNWFYFQKGVQTRSA